MSDYFKICMEAPEESGGGADDPAEEATGFVSAFSEAGWKGDRPEVTPDPVEEPEAEGEEEPETPEEVQERLYAGKYKTPEELEQAYEHAIALASRKGVEVPEVQPEPEAQMPTWRAPQYDALGEIPADGLSALQREQLSTLMQNDPKAAANWAAQNSHLLTEEEFGAIQGNWYTADPWGARQAWAAAEEAQRQERLQEEYGPTRQIVDMQQAGLGMRAAMEAVPQMMEHKDEFAQWIEDNPAIDDQLTAMTDPTEIRNALVTIFYNWYGPQALDRITQAEAERAAREEADAAAAAEAEAASQQANSRARTLTRSAPAVPAGSAASDDDIRAFIRGSRT